MEENKKLYNVGDVKEENKNNENPTKNYLGIAIGMILQRRGKKEKR